MRALTPRKVHTAALVIIPPEEIWPPIQEIRLVHDSKVKRWMPHITVLYPFAPPDDLHAIAGKIEEVCASQAPFELTLTVFDYFRHGARSFTLWLKPEPAEPLRNLHARLLKALPWYTDTSKFPHGFTPHLSVGQFKSKAEVEKAIDRYSPNVCGLKFVVDGLRYIVRSGAPDDPFHVHTVFAFGLEANSAPQKVDLSALPDRAAAIIDSAGGNRHKALHEICELLHNAVPTYDWVGFYLVDRDKPGVLVLGPYVGEPTEHVEIPFGCGICGRVAVEQTTYVSEDVTAEQNYLACSPKVRSEIVVPIFARGELVGELDIDSHTPAAFGPDDKATLERICQLIGERMF